jgi:multiple sugar transport system substrate-binding protein
VNRRRFLTAAGAAGIAGLAGCSGGGSEGTADGGAGDENTGGGATAGGNGSDSGSLSYWTLFSGGDGATMKQMVSEVNSNTDLDINRQRVPFGEYYNRLYTSLTGGEAPDIAVVHADRLVAYEDLVVPLTDYIDTSKYVDSIVSRVEVDGELLGAPLDSHPYGLWYNKDLFEEAGLDPSKPPNSPQRFKECCTAIQENTDAWPGQIHAGGLSLIVFHMWNRSRGNHLLTENNMPGFNNEDGVAVADWYDSLVNEKKWVPQSSDKGWNAWNAGRAGFLFDGTWHLSVVRKNGFDFGLAKPFTMPGSKSPVTSGNSHTLVIPRNPNRSEERTKKAAEAIRQLTQNYNVLWGKNAGHLPAYEQALNSEKLRNSKTWDQSLSTFYSMAKNGEIAYMPKTKKNGQYRKQIWQRLDAVRQNKIPPERAIERAAQGVKQVFA